MRDRKDQPRRETFLALRTVALGPLDYGPNVDFLIAEAENLVDGDDSTRETTFLKSLCCTKVIMSGVNGQVIMSGYRDDNPDDERREAARGNTKSVSRGADGGGGGDGDRNQRAAMLPDKSPGNQAWGEGSGSW